MLKEPQRRPPGLRMVYEQASSLRSDGSRNYVHPADVSGRFDLVRRVCFALLIALWAALPWIQIGGNPAVFLDVAGRRFFLFGATFNAQDVWLVFFLLSGIGYALIVMTALWGRIWCGYACPQTVFLEGLFRPVERFLEGPRNERMRRNAGPWNFDKLWRKTLKQLFYIVLAFLIAHIIISYFVSLPGLYGMVLGDPGAHPAAFAWAAGLTSVLYFDFAWFREQTCVIVCPYGRMQSVLTDQDSIVIGYDVRRGEPRGKAKAEGVGDCVECGRCQAVCPTGIDIRNGLQLDCIGCARCIDACDEVMVKLDRPKGLIRYDSLRGLEGQPRKTLRPRLFLYAGFGLAGVLAFSLAIRSSSEFEANLMRLRSLPFVVEGERVRNAFELHLVNKRAGKVEFEIEGVPAPGFDYAVAMPRVALGALESRNIPIFVSFPRHGSAGKQAVVQISIDGKPERSVSAPLIGPAN